MSYAYILVSLDLAPLCIQLSCEDAHFGMENGICVFPRVFFLCPSCAFTLSL